MREKLEALGLRLTSDYDFTLSSGIKSDVKWDIPKIFRYSKWVQIEALREWLWLVGQESPGALIGVPTGGSRLAEFTAKTLAISWCIGTSGLSCKWILIDDVLTTGATVTKYVHGPGELRPSHIAILVNRSNLTEINGIPIITGIFADPVNVPAQQKGEER